MKGWLKFFVKFVIALTLLSIVWFFVNDTFTDIALYTAYYIIKGLNYLFTLKLLNVSSVQTGGRLSGMIPFIALIIATPIEKKKLVFILKGVVIFFVLEVALFFAQLTPFSYTQEVIYLYGVGRNLLPLLLWTVFAHSVFLEHKSFKKLSLE